MFISKKKLICGISIFLSLVVFALLGTFCFNYTAYVTNSYYTGYEFGFGSNVLIEVFNVALVCFIGIITLFNLASLFITKLNDKVISIIDIVLRTIALAFSICCLCSKYVNVSYTPTNSFIFILITTLLGIASSIFTLVVQNEN